MMYRPLPKELTIKESDIDGLGLFAIEDIKAGHEFGITHYCAVYPQNHDTIRTPLGGFYNHSDNPNCETYEDGATRKLRAIKDIKAGDELTATYVLYSMEEE